MIKAIVCCSNSWAIGKNNGLLFSLKEDMKLFRETTKNKIVVCGENTLKSFPGSKPLKGRTTLVLAPVGHEYDDCITYHDFDKLVHDVKLLSITNDVFVIGGGMMYKSMLPYYDEVIVNKVDADDLEATVFFPDLDKYDNLRLSSVLEPVLDNNYLTRVHIYTRLNTEATLVN